MIRKDFLLKFKNEESAKLEVDKNSLEDDNHLLIANRLIENKDIIRMPDSKLEKFVDKILFDTKSSKLLFSSNYKKEIEMLKRSNSILKMNQSKNDKKAISKANNTIQKKREKNEIISQAKYDIDIVMKKKYDENFQKEKINEKFFQDIVGERKRVINSEEKYKRDRLRKIYANIKNKLNNVVLPNVKLDYDDVFSRLYHNAVLTQPMLNQKLNKQSSMKNLISRRESVSTLRRNFSVKNVIESNIGKEFSMKITQAQVMKCFSKNSGGPSHKYIEKSSEGCNYDQEVDNKNIIYDTILTNGNTLLHDAIINQKFSLIDYLLDKGFDINTQNNDGNSPLHLACIAKDNNRCKKQIITLLIEKNPDFNLKNNQNCLAIDLVGDMELKKFLVNELKHLHMAKRDTNSRAK